MAAIAAAFIGGVAGLGSAAISADGQPEGSELPWYVRDPTRAYFNRMSPNYPNQGGPRPHGGFLGQYDPKVYKGDTLANASSGYKDAMQAYGQVGYDPNSSTSQSEAYNQSVLAGDYLGLSDSFRQNVMSPALDAASSRFAKMGRSGLNPANVQSQNSAAMSSLAPFYENERQRMSLAAKELPRFDDMRMDRSSVFGDYQMRQQQGEINDDMRIHDFRNNKYLDQMKQWQSLLNPQTGYAPAPPTQQQPDYLGAALGGGLMGYNFMNNYSSGGGYQGAAGQGSIGSAGGNYPSDTSGMYDLGYDFNGSSGAP